MKNEDIVVIHRGSKGIKDKNIKILNGNLWYWSIKSAKNQS